MFLNKKSIIYITKNTIIGGHVLLGFKPQVKNLVELEWSEKTLPSVLLTVKKHLGSYLRILLDESFSYVFSLSIPADSRGDKSVVQKYAAEIIPEKLDEVIWDYKEILLLQRSSQDKGKRIVQVVATQKKFFEKLSLATNQSGLHIEAIEPISFTLARQTSHYKEPLLILYTKKSTLLLVSFQGLVVLTKVYDQFPQAEFVQEAMTYASERFNLQIKKMLICADATISNPKDYEELGLSIQPENQDPFIGLSLKKDLQGKDERVLNLEILKIKPPPTASAPSPQALTVIKSKEQQVEIPLAVNIRKKSKAPLYFFIIFLLVFFTFLGFIFFKKQFKDPIAEKVEVINPIQPTSQPTADNLISSQEAKLDQYSIQILNGSGKAGAAGKMSDLLTEKKYSVDNTDNADNYDYEKTEIQTKKKVNSLFKQNLEKVLKSSYSVIEGKSLSDESEYDIIIIIGKESK